MPIAILGGIRFGIVTPTEAAVVATVYALIVGMFVYRELKPADLYKVTLTAARTTSAVMLLGRRGGRISLAHHAGQHSSGARRACSNPSWATRRSS